MSKYTLDVKKVFRGMKSPVPGFIVDLVEYPDYLALRVYRDNIESFSQPQKIALAEHLYKLRDAIGALGVKCYLEGVEYDPK